jgi:membrane protein DedA with SNARE-associated domain
LRILGAGQHGFPLAGVAANCHNGLNIAFFGRLSDPMEELLRRYGLWAVFVGAMIEGDLTLILSGVLARAGVFSFAEALVVGTAGGFVGDSLSYLVGARCRARARSFQFFRRARPRIERLMRKFGVLSIFIVKYVYGLRTASAMFWGLAHFGYAKFAPLTLVSCVAWVGILAGLGFTFATGLQKLLGDLRNLEIMFLLALVIAGTVYVIYRFERRVIEEDKEFFGGDDDKSQI